MSRDNVQSGVSSFHRFRDLVLSDAGLQAQLAPIENVDAFIARAVEVARAHGCEITPGELRDALRAAHLSWIQRWI